MRFQRLDLALLVHVQHQRPGRRLKSPTMSRTLATNCGSLDNLEVS